MNKEVVTTRKWLDPGDMVTASLLLTKRAVLLTQQQPKQQIPGIFAMSRTQLEWKPNIPDPSQEVIANVATISGQHLIVATDLLRLLCKHEAKLACAGQLQRAKNKPMLRIPLRNSFLILQFDNLEDRDVIVDTLTPLVQQVQNKGKQALISDQFSGPPALVAIKKKMLSSDR